MAIYFNPHPVQLEESVTTIETNTTNVPDVYDVTPRIVSVDTVSAASTAWTQAAHRLFTVTGVVKVKVFGVVTTTIVGAGTLGVGVAGATNGLIATVADNTTLAAGDIVSNYTTATIVPVGRTSDWAIVADTDIDMIIGTANATAGKITFYCEWIPISSGATVVAATWD